MKHYSIRTAKVRTFFRYEFKAVESGVYSKYSDKYSSNESILIDEVAYLPGEYVGHMIFTDSAVAPCLSSLSSDDICDRKFIQAKTDKNLYYQLCEAQDFHLSKTGEIKFFGSKNITLDFFLNNYVLIDENGDIICENWLSFTSQLKLLSHNKTELIDVYFSYYRTLINILYLKHSELSNITFTDIKSARQILSKPVTDKKYKLEKKYNITEAEFMLPLVSLDGYIPYSNSSKFFNWDSIKTFNKSCDNYKDNIDVLADFISSVTIYNPQDSKISLIDHRMSEFDDSISFELRLKSIANTVLIGQAETALIKRKTNIDELSFYELDQMYFLFMKSKDYTLISIFPTKEFKSILYST